MTEPFHFPNGRAANNAQDLLELCEQCPDEATNFLVGQDLEKWLAYIGSHDVAECAANARQTDAEDRQKLEDFLNKCHSLSSPEPVISAEIPTDIKDNMTAPDSATAIPSSTPEAPTADVSVVKNPETEVKETPNPAPVAAAVVEKPAANPAQSSGSPTSTHDEEKPSFFQVVAKFIVKILYRDKA